ncbi:MAG: Sec-independent protein translocase subunit TatA [Candidatus Nanopelagicales bacterium]|jgi:sec-independent protein translocase protein TatA
MPFNLRGPEILILVLIILLLFGAKRLPDVARGMGRSLRIFKAETKELSADDADDVVDDAPPASSTTPPTSLPPAPAESTPAPPQAERTES